MSPCENVTIAAVAASITALQQRLSLYFAKLSKWVLAFEFLSGYKFGSMKWNTRPWKNRVLQFTQFMTPVVTSLGRRAATRSRIIQQIYGKRH